MPLSHPLTDQDREVVTSGIYSHFPKGKAFSGVDHRISSPLLKEQLLAGGQRSQHKGLQRNSCGLCLYLCFCWSLKWGEIRGKSSHLGLLILPPKKGSNCLWSPQYWDKHSAACLLRLVKLWPRCAYFFNSKSGWFYYFGVIFANEKEKTAWAERIWWLGNYFEIPGCLPRCSPGCLPSPRSRGFLSLNNVPGTTSQAMAPMSPTLQRLCSHCFVPDDDTKATAERFTTQAHTARNGQMGLRAQRG